MRINKTKWKKGNKIVEENNLHELRMRGDSFCSKCSAWKGQLGLEPTFELYLKHMLQVTLELKRVLKKTGTFFLNIGDTYFGGGGGNYGNGLSSLQGKSHPTNFLNRMNGYEVKCLIMIPERLALGMIEQGWILRNKIIWHKPNHMPSSVKDRFTNSYEPIFMLVKSKKYFFDLDSVREPHKFPSDDIRRMNQDKQADVNPFNKGTKESRHPKFGTPEYEKWYFEQREKKSWHPHTADAQMGFGQQKRLEQTQNLPHPLGKNPSDFWEITTQPFPDSHFAVFPEKLVEKCIKAGCPKDGIVLDPFVGSGTVLKVAIEQRRNAIGIDIKLQYIKMAMKRCNLPNPFINFELIK